MKNLGIIFLSFYLIVAWNSRIAQGADPQLSLDKGNAHFNDAEFDSAIKDYSEALSINPNLAEAYYNRGQAYYKRERLGGYQRLQQGYGAAH